MKLDHKKLAAKYWDMMHPHVNFYNLKEKQIQDQYEVMEKFLETIKDMETPQWMPEHDRKGGFYDANDALVTEGDYVEHIDGRKGTLIEALQDGDADIKWDDGKFGQVKWRNLIKI